MGDLADTDVLPLAIAHLNAYGPLAELLGGEGRVGALNEPPYPRVVLTDPPGSDLDLRHLLAPMLQVEAIGDPDGTTGKPMLRRVVLRCLQALKELPERPYVGGPVITEVTSTGGHGYSPYPTGQQRYLATVQVYVHPPTQPAPSVHSGSQAYEGAGPPSEDFDWDGIEFYLDTTNGDLYINEESP